MPSQIVNASKRVATARSILILRAMKILRNIRGLLFDGLDGARGGERLRAAACNYLDLSSEWIITRGHWNVTFNNEGR